MRPSPAAGTQNFAALVENDIDSFPQVRAAEDSAWLRSTGALIHRVREGRRVDDDSLLQRVLPEDRVFSQESAREIFSLVITSNMAVLPGRETAVDGSAA